MEITRRGTPARKRLDALEQQIAALRRELRSIVEANWPIDEVLQKVRRDLDAQVAHSPIFADLSYYKLSDGEEMIGSEAKRALNRPLTIIELSVLIGRDELLKRLRPILASGSGPEGLPADARAARVKELKEQISTAEAQCELEVLALEQAGHNVLRRDDVDVGVLLDVWARADGTKQQARVR
jgi:hypothetical protein